MSKKIIHVTRQSEKDPNLGNLMKNLKNCDNYILSIPEPLLNKEFYKLQYIKMKFDALREIFCLKPDILIIYEHFGFPFGTILLIISRMLGIKTIIQSDIPENALPKLKKNITKFVREIVRYPFFVSQALLVDAIVCFTDYEKDNLSKIFTPENKVWIIPSGCNIEIGTEEKEDYILTVATWSDRKNLQMILKVIAKILEHRKCKLVVVGDFFKGEYYVFDEDRYETGEEYRQKIMKLKKHLNLNDYVDFVGIKGGNELQELYRKAKIFYLPSKMETLGRVYIEAMASGTPIVAMKNSAVQYVVKDGVTGFLRNTEEGQKEAILRLLNDEELYRRMQKNCLREAEKYKWEIVANEWEKVIQSLAH